MASVTGISYETYATDNAVGLRSYSHICGHILAGGVVNSRLSNSYFDLAVPPMVVLLVVIVGWRYLTRLFGSNDSFSDLLLATFILALGASLVSAFYLAIRVGTFWSNLGEKGGAVMLIGIFTSALFSFLALPPAFVLPRVLDPALRLRVFRSPQ